MNLGAVHHRDRLGAISQQWKRRGKSRTFTDAFTVCGHGTAMKLDQMANDREAQTKTTETPRRRTVRLSKTIEHARQKLGRDSLARVAHRDGRVRVVAGNANVDLAAVWGELHCVRKQVPNDLLQAGRVGGDRTETGLGPVVQRDALRIRRRLHHVDRRACYRTDVERSDVEM